MFLTQTYHLSTAGRVQLKFGNNKRPSVGVCTSFNPKIDENTYTSHIVRGRNDHDDVPHAMLHICIVLIGEKL